jgi:hypothetical protein
MRNYLLYTVVAIWNEPPRARQQIANELKEDGKVYFVERNKIGLPHITIKEQEKNVFVITPYFPLNYKVRYRTPGINELYHKWLLKEIKKLDIAFEFVMTFDYTAPAIHKYFNNVIFYCADDNVGFGNFNPGWVNKYHTKTERLVAEKAKLCIVTSDYMQLKIGNYNTNTHVVPLGAPDVQVNGYKHIYKKEGLPTLGLVGYLDSNMDDDLLDELLSKFKTIVIGPTKKENAQKISKYPNAEFVGVKTGPKLYECLSRADVCIAPYDVNKLNKGATPNKLWLYLALGKPAVVTNMPNIENWQFPDNLVYKCDNKRFIEMCIKAYVDDNPGLSFRRKEIARDSSWKKRVEKIRELYADTVTTKLPTNHHDLKILAVASAGGHWVELLRLKPAFNGYDVKFMSTNESFAATVQGHKFYCVPEVSRWNKSKLFKVAYEMAKVISTVKPDVIISTGAAPGVVSIIIGKMKGIKTIWVESMCHVERISLSGKIARFFADQTYTQWPHLASPKILYKGNIMS